METDNLLTVAEAARRCGVKRQAIQRAIQDKRIAATKIWNRWVIHEDALKEYTRRNYPEKQNRRQPEEEGGNTS